jgi:hypothetical protein
LDELRGRDEEHARNGRRQPSAHVRVPPGLLFGCIGLVLDALLDPLQSIGEVAVPLLPHGSLSLKLVNRVLDQTKFVSEDGEGFTVADLCPVQALRCQSIGY